MTDIHCTYASPMVREVAEFTFRYATLYDNPFFVGIVLHGSNDSCDDRDVKDSYECFYPFFCLCLSCTNKVCILIKALIGDNAIVCFQMKAAEMRGRLNATEKRSSEPFNLSY